MWRRIITAYDFRRNDEDTPEGISLEDALAQGLVTQEDVKRALDALDAQDELRESPIGDHKRKRARELAKRLSVTPAFLAAVSEFRARWSLTEVPVPGEPYDLLLTAEDVLRERILLDGATDETWQESQRDMERNLCTPFRLDWLHDYGLLVVAVLHGLSPSVIVHEWDKVETLAARETSPGATIAMNHSDSRLQAGAAMAIAYLAARLNKAGLNEEDLPSPISAWLKWGMSVFDALHKEVFKSGHLNFASLPAETIVLAFAPESIQRIGALPDSPPTSPPELYIRIHPETTRADVDRTWPQVELRKAELWGRNKHPQLREWLEYKRDVELFEIHGKLKDYRSTVAEYHRRHPEENFVVDGIIRDDSIERVRKAISRMRERCIRTAK